MKNPIIEEIEKQIDLDFSKMKVMQINYLLEDNIGIFVYVNKVNVDGKIQYEISTKKYDIT